MSDQLKQVVGDISADQKSTAGLVHFLGIILNFWSGLIFFLINSDKPDKAFVIDNAKEQLNWAITLIIGYFAAALSSIIVIGIFLFPVLGIMQIVFGIKAGLAAQNGKQYRYPFTIRLIK
jgi:uncharacterized Tic20 family protein